MGEKKGCYGKRASAVAPLGRVTTFHGEGGALVIKMTMAMAIAIMKLGRF